MKYILKSMDSVLDNGFGGGEKKFDTSVTFEFEEETLWSVLERIECFLRGSGFVFDGSLAIVENDEGYRDNCETSED